MAVGIDLIGIAIIMFGFNVSLLKLLSAVRQGEQKRTFSFGAAVEGPLILEDRARNLGTYKQSYLP